MSYWLELGRAHYEAMGVEPVLLDVRTRAEADDPTTAARLDGAGLVYLSGGDPHHLPVTLRDTALWRAIVAAWRDGAALAGCSAGAMALTSGAPDDPRPHRGCTPARTATSPARQRAGPDRIAGRHPPLRPDGALPARGPGVVRLVAARGHDPGRDRGGDRHGVVRAGTGRSKGPGRCGSSTPPPRARFAAGDEVPLPPPSG